MKGGMTGEGGDDDAAAPRPGGGGDGCKTPLACLQGRLLCVQRGASAGRA